MAVDLILDDFMDNLTKKFTPTTLMKRVLNYIIDFIIRVIIFLFLDEFIRRYSPYYEHPLLVDVFWDIILPIIMWFLISFVMYTSLEFYFNGKTIGKLVTKTRVVSLEENTLNIKYLIKRSLIRLLPFEEISCLFLSYYPHDKFSKTIVIDD